MQAQRVTELAGAADADGERSARPPRRERPVPRRGGRSHRRHRTGCSSRCATSGRTTPRRTSPTRVAEIWDTKVRYQFWAAHATDVEDDFVELLGATRPDSTGRYVTVHLVAQRVGTAGPAAADLTVLPRPGGWPCPGSRGRAWRQIDVRAQRIAVRRDDARSLLAQAGRLPRLRRPSWPSSLSRSPLERAIETVGFTDRLGTFPVAGEPVPQRPVDARHRDPRQDLLAPDRPLRARSLRPHDRAAGGRRNARVVRRPDVHQDQRRVHQRSGRRRPRLLQPVPAGRHRPGPPRRARRRARGRWRRSTSSLPTADCDAAGTDVSSQPVWSSSRRRSRRRLSRR